MTVHRPSLDHHERSAARVPGAVLPLPGGQAWLRDGLCGVAHSQMRTEQRISEFHFHSPTLLLILSGTLTFLFPHGPRTLTPDEGFALVNPGQFIDLNKQPADDGSPFRSLFITVSEATLDRFRQFYSTVASAAENTESALRTTRAFDALLPALLTLLENLKEESLSDTRLEVRLFDLLLCLAEQGLAFSPPSRSSTGERLRRLLEQQPERRWTTKIAGHALAMSEATLRRRLNGENMKFDALLREVRLQHGMTLLQPTSWPLTQIADASGYLSAARFSARFRTRFGISPARLR